MIEPPVAYHTQLIYQTPSRIYGGGATKCEMGAVMELTNSPMTERQRNYREIYRNRVVAWYNGYRTSRSSTPSDLPLYTSTRRISSRFVGGSG